MLKAEYADRCRSQQQSRGLVRGQASPTRADDAQHMAVRDEQPAAAVCASALDQRVNAVTDFGRALAAWAAVGEEPPVGLGLLNLDRCDPLVLAVVPFRQLIGRLRVGTVAGQLAGLSGALQWARENVIELHPGKPLSGLTRLVAAILGQLNVAEPGMAAVKRPLCFAVAQQDNGALFGWHSADPMACAPKIAQQMDSANPDPSPDPDTSGLLASLHRVDASLYASIAASSTPNHDDRLALISNAANHSKPWIASAAALSIFGRRRGRRAALYGIASIATSATVVNVALKPLTRRRRPDRVAAGVIEARHVEMPTSTSFPSGHSASAFAFATGVFHVMPIAGALLAIPAGLVAYSRIHTGVHYPGDVLVGSLTGIALAKLTCAALDRRSA